MTKVIWHVGTAGYYTQLHPIARNKNTIGIEMATWNEVDGYTVNPYWELTTATQESCVLLCQYLMETYGIPAENVLRHGDIVNKDCPAPYTKYDGQCYKENWSWSQFKARLTGEEIESKPVEECTIDYTRKIDDVTLEDIAKIIYAEFGIASGKNYDCLLGVSQCIYDIWKAGTEKLSVVLKNAFTTPSEKYSTDCLKAAYEVFEKGVKRFSDAQILQFRSFTKYGKDGEPDPEKCADLLSRYEYLGSDSLDEKWGHLYFGKKVEMKPAEEKKPLYRVLVNGKQEGAFEVEDNAFRFAQSRVKEGSVEVKYSLG